MIEEDMEENGAHVKVISYKYKYRGIAVFNDQLHLYRFPFDWQRLSIRVISARPYQARLPQPHTHARKHLPHLHTSRAGCLTS
jgi:hypothetical protein